MIKAPIIVGPLEFDGIENELILVELDDTTEGINALRPVLANKLILIFSPMIDVNHDCHNADFRYAVCVQVDSVYKIYNYLKEMQCKLDYILVDRIDMMDAELSPKERGAQQNAFICMLSAPKNLRGGNIIVTSANDEQSLKKKASRYLNLKSK